MRNIDLRGAYTSIYESNQIDEVAPIIAAGVGKLAGGMAAKAGAGAAAKACLLYTSPSPRDGLLSRMPSSA